MKLNFRSLTWMGACCLAVAGSAEAQAPRNDGHVRLAGLVNTYRMARAAQGGLDVANPTAYLSLRGGAMVSPRGAGLAGADATLPGFELFPGWQTRLDADVIFKANFGGINTIVPVTINQVYYPAESVGGRTVYFGGGLGAVLSGPARFDGKLILGAEMTSRLGGELNVHFTEGETLLTVLARIHL